MKTGEKAAIIRRAISTAHCMDLDTFIKVFEVPAGRAHFETGNWRHMQGNFASWYCGLDSRQLELFITYSEKGHE